jgi:hypothetical protein
MNRNQTRIARATSAILLLAVAGCVSTSPVDRHFGEAVNMMKAQQTLNPTAALNADPVRGIDGQAAKSAYDQYQKSFKTPEPQPNAFTIGVAGAR